MQDSTTTAAEFVVSVETLRSVSAAVAEPLWRNLEARATCSFFLSWNWIVTVLETSGTSANLLVARSSDRIVGLGLVSPARRWRLGMTWPTISLNETGRKRLDSVYIEDNGFLAETGWEHKVTAACLCHLLKDDAHWAEMRLHGVTRIVADMAARMPLTAEIDAERPCPFIDLRTVATNEFRGFGPNARQQIARSERLYCTRGELTLAGSRDLSEALGRLAEMKLLHQRRWRARGKPGAFAEPFFERFHRALLARAFPIGNADVVRVAIGTETIGLLYTFFYGGDAYAYQNGFRYEADQRLKPGLVSHALMIRHCRARGLARYRLLAGDSRYKRSLCDDAYPLYWLSLRRSHPAFRLERAARLIVGRGHPPHAR